MLENIVYFFIEGYMIVVAIVIIAFPFVVLGGLIDTIQEMRGKNNHNKENK